MTIEELISLTQAQVQSGGRQEQQVTCGFVCDLLSWAMAHGQKDMAWVTVQTNINVVAVAALHEIACVILPENVRMEGAALEKAKEENIWVLSSGKSAYKICGLLYAKGIQD